MVKHGRIVTGAHYGLLDWLAQRVTAAVMVVYLLLLAALLLVAPPLTSRGKHCSAINGCGLLPSFFWLACIGMPGSECATF